MPGSAWNALQTAAPWNFPHHRGNGSIIVIPTTEENKKTLQCWITSMIIINILHQKQLLSKEKFSIFYFYVNWLHIWIACE